jgi:hypothetical protein
MERIYKQHSTKDLLTALSNCALGDSEEDFILTKGILVEFVERGKNPSQVFIMLDMFENRSN